jgi:GAF domain-containing protein
MSRRSKAGGEPAKSRRGKPGLKRRSASKLGFRRIAPARQETEVARLTRDRNEAREQQRATAEILRVIRNSPADVQPVFEMIVRSAVSLCGSLYANVFRFDGDLLHFVASHNVGPIAVPRASVPTRKNWRHYVDLMKAKYPMRPDSSQVTGRVLLTKSVVRLEDALIDPHYDQLLSRAIGFRRLLGVPMLREGDPLGAIVAGWAEAGPVPKVQEELLKTFADQAVIAIENARLLNELRQSLQQQTATAEVLRVINSSAGTLAPVFEAILDKAMQLCEAAFGGMWTLEADRYTAVALRGVPQPYAAFLAETTIVPGPGTSPYRLLRGERFVHNIDLAAEEAYRAGDPQRRALVDLGGARTALQVLLRKDDAVLGFITIYRKEVRPFNEKQIELVENFAGQAVIAIENARLLDDLSKLNQQLEQRVADQVGEIERMGRLRRFLPPQVADLIVASGTEKQLESHRREITALFCDLRGFTRF